MDRSGRVSARRVEPHGLLAQPPAWYLLAHDLDRDAPRMFRLDRMHAPAVRAERFVPDPQRVFEPLVHEVGEVRPALAIHAASVRHPEDEAVTRRPPPRAGR